MSLSCACPEHYPDWVGKDVNLGGHCVHSLSIPTLLHMPLGYEAYLKRQYHDIQALRLTESWPNLVLTRTGMFRGTITRLLEKTTSPSHRIEYLPNPFHVRGKLHLGDVGTIRNSVREIQMELLDKGKLPKELYLCYLTCPLCRDERGGNKILLLRRWTESTLLKKR
ncbi:MAG: hypothetical protein P8079_07485 [Gammaproteobacteria bacterium]